MCVCVYVSLVSHVNFGGLGEGPDGVDVVVEDDDAHHHPHTEEHGVCVGEATAILTGGRERERERERERGRERERKKSTKGDYNWI